MTNKLLLPALRQYKHNNGEGLVAAFDFHKTQVVVAVLEQKVEEMKTHEEMQAEAWQRTMDILNQPQEPSIIEKIFMRGLVVMGLSAFVAFIVLLFADILKG